MFLLETLLFLRVYLDVTYEIGILLILPKWGEPYRRGGRWGGFSRQRKHKVHGVTLEGSLDFVEELLGLHIG